MGIGSMQNSNRLIGVLYAVALGGMNIPGWRASWSSLYEPLVNNMPGPPHLPMVLRLNSNRLTSSSSAEIRNTGRGI